MDTMGKIWMIAASLAGMAAVSCSGDGYEPGQEDVENCPDVYFDAGQSGNFAFDQTEEIELTFTVSRLNTADTFVVPLDIAGPEGIIDVTPLIFESGQESSEIVVRVLSDLEMQREYEFVLSIPAPDYAPLYGLNETSLTISIIREDYEQVGRGSFRSELLGPGNSRAVLQYSEILDRYRIVSPWGSEGNIVFIWDGSSEKVDFDEDASFFIAQISTVDGVFATYGEPESGSYDPDTKTFTFNIWYGVPSEGDTAGFGYSEDTYELE